MSLTKEQNQIIEDTMKKELEKAYLRGLEAGCKTIAAWCMETIKKEKSGVALWKISAFCKKTIELPEDGGNYEPAECGVKEESNAD